MTELGIPFSEEDLSKPTYQRMKLVYEAFSDILMGITWENYDNFVRACHDELEYSGIYVESLGIIIFHQKLIRLMTEVGIDDFSIRDLIKPEAGRVKKILSAVINFAKFREERMPVFETHAQKAESYVSRHQDLVFQNQDLSEKLKNLKMKQADEVSLIKKSKEINVALTNDLRELKKIQTALTNEIDVLKREKAEIAERLSNNQFITVNTKQECMKLRSRIVHSPEKLKQLISDMGSSLASEKSSIASLEKKSRELQNKIDAIGTVEQDILNCIKLMEECEIEIAKVEEASRKVAKHQEMVDQKELEVREVEVKDQQLNRQLANAEDKLARIQRSAEAKRETAQKKMAEIRKEYNIITVERAERAHEMDRKRTIIESTEKKISELRSHIESEVLAIQNEYSKLKSHVELYMDEMNRCMEIATTS
ncbi:hypothetical protein T552_02650 [Pneumocystis carinii B80]|uniref:Uncharacterized protein n=1 Tax=Pneumocystis carinii (strain B80) TaxID=1408658 RepID=A0A0W4ZE48_PNEC8|nr:hypothetical protein T552_02650 [Pneumocystis carinii B80]KTW26641.1 hypothetical protein T552_02650 [Pneumocystis carinii B80]